jgi:hypothetical protein
MAVPMMIEWLGASGQAVIVTFPATDAEHKIPAMARRWRADRSQAWKKLLDMPRDWWDALLAGENDQGKEYWRGVIRSEQC